MTKIKRLLAALFALVALTAALAASAPVASANNAGVACNAIRYNGSQVNAAQTFMNPYFGAFNYYWINMGVTPVGYLGNQSQLRADGSGWCTGHWWAHSNNNNKPPLGCMYYANVNAAGQVTIVRPAIPGDSPTIPNYPCHN